MDTVNQFATDMDAPIALRRSKRKSSVLSSPKKPHANHTDVTTRSKVAATPTRRSKRVRFSDSALPSNTNPLATGITPHLRRASLGTPRSRVPSTPTTSSRTFRADVDFTPFRQVLDDRSKRRIKRNGMSEEMNEYTADKRTNVKLQQEIEAKDAELKQLRLALEESRQQPQSGSLPVNFSLASQERVDEVEAELEALRQSFALEEAQPIQSWKHVPVGTQGPSSDGGDTIQIYEDDDVIQISKPTAQVDADALAMGLEIEAARQAKKSFLGSFRENSPFTKMNFADSPARRQHKAIGTSPRTPRSLYHDLSKQLKATTSRAEEAELALKALETEILSLGFGQESSDASGVVAAVTDHFRQARLDLERAVPGETTIAFENAKVLPEIIDKLRTLSAKLRNRETELRAARDQQHNLKNNFEKAIVAAEKATARIKDLESSIDSTAEEMLHLRIRAQNLEKDLAEKEKDVTTLTTALNKYRADVSRLETLITNLENSHASALTAKDQTISDLDAKATAETRGRRAAETSAVARLAKISELESALSMAKSHADRVEEAMSKLQSHVSSSTTTHTDEVGNLNTRISNLSTALASANAEVEKLRNTKSRLEERVRQEVEQGARTVEAIQADLLRSLAKSHEKRKSYMRGTKVRSANWELQSDDLESDGIEQPLTPASMVRFAEFSEEISPGGSRAGSEDNTDATGNDENRGRGTRRHQQQDDQDLLPPSVEIGRGLTPRQRSRSADRRKGLGLGILKQKPKRKYDSGVGLSSDIDVEYDDTDDQQLTQQGRETEEERRDDSGYGSDDISLMTPDLPSDVVEYVQQQQEKQQTSKQKYCHRQRRRQEFFEDVVDENDCRVLGRTNDVEMDV